MTRTLKERLREWSDIDCAMDHLAQALGIVEPDGGPKWMYWSDNATGNLLYETLSSMHKSGLLEFRGDGPTDSQFRWNPHYLAIPTTPVASGEVVNPQKFGEDAVQAHPPLYNPVVRTLADYMSSLSEEAYCAGWLDSLEFDLWRAVVEGPFKYGFIELTQRHVRRLRDLSQACDGWVVWDDGEHYVGNRFVPMAQWERIYSEHQRIKASKARE